MPHNGELIWDGRLPAHRVRVDEIAPLRAATPEYLAGVDAEWSRRLRLAPRDALLFDGPLLNVVSHHVETDGAGEQLVITGNHTSYRHWVFAQGRHDWVCEQFGTALCCRPLAVAAAVCTADGYAVLQVRSQRVVERPGGIHAAAGHLDPTSHLSDGHPDPYLAILAELDEELGLSTADLTNGEVVGLMLNPDNGKPELLYSFETGLNSTAIAARGAACDLANEVAALLFAPLEMADFREWCGPYAQRLTEPTRVLLARLGLTVP